MIGFVLTLICRGNVKCSVCGWEASRSHMWRNCPGVWVCRSERACYWRFCAPAREEQMEREREWVAAERARRIAELKRELTAP